jgi:hypothetical protein
MVPTTSDAVIHNIQVDAVAIATTRATSTGQKIRTTKMMCSNVPSIVDDDHDEMNAVFVMISVTSPILWFKNWDDMIQRWITFSIHDGTGIMISILMIIR